jgi:cell division protein FtsI (penicillin-binding protein 3)
LTPARFQLRAIVGLGVLVVALAGLLVRLTGIQVGAHADWSDRAGSQHVSGRRTVAADRGAVTDRHGRPLARTEHRPSVAVDPRVVRERHELERLAPILLEELGVDVRPIVLGAKPSSQFRWVRRKLTDREAVARAVERAREAEVTGLIVQHEAVRAYPSGHVGAHVVGFTYEAPDGTVRGAAGAERLADEQLRGTPGWRRFERDGNGRPIVRADHDGCAPVHGADVRLTIDAVVQAFAEEEAEHAWTEFEPRSVSVGVLDVRSGELLAVANRPTFDPAQLDGDADARRNPFFENVFEPGSTFKPIAMAVALETGVVGVDEVLDTNPGTIQVGRRRIREDKHKNYGELTPGGVIAKSSNVGMAILALRVGIPRMHAAVRMFGFGARTGIGWAGESAGMITPRSRWTEAYTLCSVSFGQEIAVTPAQLLAAYGALANDGVLQPLRLLADRPEKPPVRVLRAVTAQRVAPMTEAVFQEGTASRIDTGGYRMGGKTGTAEQKDKQGNIEYVGSFACFAPVEAPRLAVLVVVDRPQGSPYGSRVAAPGAVRLLRNSLRYLGVAPRPRPAERAADELLEVNPR